MARQPPCSDPSPLGLNAMRQDSPACIVLAFAAAPVNQQARAGLDAPLHSLIRLVSGECRPSLRVLPRRRAC